MINGYYMAQLTQTKVRFYRQVATIFVLLTAALLVAVFYFSLAKAEIRVIPLAQMSNVDFIVLIQPEANGEEVLAGQVAQTTTAGEKKFIVTKTQEVKGSVLGEVTIYNTTNNSQVLVATTRLLASDNTLLRINRRVTVPARGEAVVEVYADQPEQFISLEPTKFTIPGLHQELQAKIYAESKSSLSAGGRQVKILTAEEIEQAKKSYSEELTAQALETLAQKTGVISIVKEQATVEVGEFSVNEPVGTETDDFIAKLSLKVTAVIYDQQKLTQLAQTKLLGYAPQTREIAGFTGSQLGVEVQSYDLAKQQAKLRVSYQTNVWLQPGLGILDKSKIAGLSSAEVKQYFMQFPEIKSVTIKLSPPWSKRLPQDQSKIDLKVVSQ